MCRLAHRRERLLSIGTFALAQHLHCRPHSAKQAALPCLCHPNMLVEPRPEEACARLCPMLSVSNCRTSLPPPDPLDEDLQRADRLAAASLTNGRISPQLLLGCGLSGAWGLPLMQPDPSRWCWAAHTSQVACRRAGDAVHASSASFRPWAWQWPSGAGCPLADQAVQLQTSVTHKSVDLQAPGKGHCDRVENLVRDAAGLAIANTSSCPCMLTATPWVQQACLPATSPPTPQGSGGGLATVESLTSCLWCRGTSPSPLLLGSRGQQPTPQPSPGHLGGDMDLDAIWGQQRSQLQGQVQQVWPRLYRV